MTFTEATDALMARGVGLRDVGEALGVAYVTVRAYRSDPEGTGHRRPPEGWQDRLADLAQTRSASLERLATLIREG